MDEGVAQLFTNDFNGRKIIGTVGQLQFEVIEYRLCMSTKPSAVGSLLAFAKPAGSRVQMKISRF